MHEASTCKARLADTCSRMQSEAYVMVNKSLVTELQKYGALSHLPQLALITLRTGTCTGFDHMYQKSFCAVFENKKVKIPCSTDNEASLN